MLINIAHNPPPLSCFNGQPKLLFVCKALGKDNAIQRMMHSHQDRLEIMFIYKGNGNYIIDGEFYSVKEGDLLIFNSGSIHDEQPLPSQDLIIYSCGITHLSLANLADNHIITKQQIPVLNVGRYAASLVGFFEQFITYSTQNSELKNEVMHYSVMSFILMVYDIFNTHIDHISHKKITLGQRIKELLDKYYLQGITVHSISEALNVNRYYLSHVFKDFSGLSPKQYIIRRRIGEAQSLLLNTNDSVEKIAHRVGYHNVNNFHSIFEKVLGMSPVKYKKLWLKKYSES